MNPIADIARKYIGAGLSVLPIRPDGSKAPDVPEWKIYQQRFPTAEEALNFRPESGVAVVAGAVSGNLEIYDFDDAASFTQWAELVESQLGKEFFERLTVVKTPRPGFHVYTRCDVIAGNTKLAQITINDGPRPTIKTMIETRGEGGYVLAPGCPSACHETGRMYERVQGEFRTIPRITAEQRDVLMSCARSFNQIWREEAAAKPAAIQPGSPGAEYCQQASWTDILAPHGFKPAGKRGDSTMWTRPGKDHGVSASTNHNGSNLFYSFSTNCYPFDSERGYNKFGVYTLLNHNGDFHVAARVLASEGYGAPSLRKEKSASAPTPTTEQLVSEILTPDSLMERLKNLYKHGVEKGASPGWLTVANHWTVRKGEWTLVTGTPSHGKSSFVDGVMVNLARSHGWKWAVWSAENLPQELHIVNLLEQYIGLPFHEGRSDRMTEADIDRGMRFINEYFRFLSPPEDEETIPRLLALTETAAIDGLVIDPWNELTHDYGRDKETDYVSKQLKLISRFVKRQKIHAIIVAHPAKPQKEKINGDMKYPVPTPYDVSGSSHFRNKADCCLCVWRDESQPGTSTLFIQKIRRRFVGRTGSVPLLYDTVTGRFSDPNYRREPGDEE